LVAGEGFEPSTFGL